MFKTDDNYLLFFILFKCGDLVHVDDQANQTGVIGFILWAIYCLFVCVCVCFL